MPGSRDAILAALRRATLPECPAAALDFTPVRFEDPAARFAEALEAAGGRCVEVSSGQDVGEVLRGLPVFAMARRVYSALPGEASTQDVARPHDLADLDLAVLSGTPAVAESGAVWVVPPDLQARAAAFLAQHLVLVVPRSALVHELHAAYARIDAAASAFGCFVAGPSKTADIEQALVIGAHGPRSLHVLLCDD